MDQAPKLVVQLHDVRQPDVRGIQEGQCAEPRHLVHASEHAPVGRLGELYFVGDKIADCVRRELFGVEGVLRVTSSWSSAIEVSLGRVLRNSHSVGPIVVLSTRGSEIVSTMGSRVAM